MNREEKLVIKTSYYRAVFARLILLSIITASIFLFEKNNGLFGTVITICTLLLFDKRKAITLDQSTLQYNPRHWLINRKKSFEITQISTIELEKRKVEWWLLPIAMILPFYQSIITDKILRIENLDQTVDNLNVNGFWNKELEQIITEIEKEKTAANIA